ncbi:hypothetical protein SLE2022_106980 [Rubroshorea leprosula]|uniref:Peptidase A1 domain-containing protein n=1 Tax=Rubroshorea leprosula TaxID=152421 RepID=A0AAV5IDP1_9ROSI|nr:hypothetical protein SLEP1_g10786 [Rubroshorea leprosula]
MTQKIPFKYLPRSPKKLSFHHKVTLTASLTIGTLSQNVSMVIDTDSDLSWLNCNISYTNTGNISEPFTFDKHTILFWVGSHGESKMNKDCCWDDDGDGFEREEMKRKGIKKGGDMLLA